MLGEGVLLEEHLTDATADLKGELLLEMEQGMMPDSVVSACSSIDGVEVLWVSRYPAGGNLVMDLEAVEELTARGANVIDPLVET